MKPGTPPDLAASLFGNEPAHRLLLLKAAWPAAVGPALAGRSEAVSLDGEVLRIRVPDGIWRRSLWRMRSDLLSRLRQVAGRAAPWGLSFVEGRVESASTPRVVSPEPPPRAPLPAPVAAAAAAIPDDELRRGFERAAERYFGRFGEGSQDADEEASSG